MKNRSRPVQTAFSRLSPLVLLFLLVNLIFLSGCEATTITEQPGNYVYSQDEPILILDIETRDSLLALTFTGVTVLRDEPFTLREESGHSENGETLYADVPYEALIRIEYDCEILSPRQSKPNSLNFDVSDSEGKRASRNPEIDYTVENPSGTSTHLIVALKHKGDFVDINFNHKFAQTRPTARIRLEVGAFIPPAESVRPETAAPESPSSLSPVPEPITGSSVFFTNFVPFLLGLLVFLLFVILPVVIVLILIITRKRSR